VKVCTAGLWHLGTVTAACLASGGHDVVGYDDNAATISALATGRPPVEEPGLEALVRVGLEAGWLRFSTDPADALRGADVLWITWDTPVDEDDRADRDMVIRKSERLFPHLAPGMLVLVSSQLPVGSTAGLAARCATLRQARDISFACVPENLRLGKAIDVFTKPDRVVVGSAGTSDRERIGALLAPFTDRIEWMSIESAEMTKHALNAFLATSVAFLNEIASLCERVGADAGEVSRGLKTDERIGPRAYVSPGAAFAGGTLARDLVFLGQLGAVEALPLRLIPAVRESNELHRQWAVRRLEVELGTLAGRTVAIWGLTYKPGTDTLRRSSSVALCETLLAGGATVRVFDPAVKCLPDSLAMRVVHARSALEAAHAADAMVAATEWPEFGRITSDAYIAAEGASLVLDASRVLSRTLGNDPRVRYVTVGSSGP
jgi:UDPglucose 6-dehydrogenase